MAQPKFIYPIYEIEQPSTKKNIKFRPYLVKEEKILLMAKESKQIKDAFGAVKQILKACCEETKDDFIDKMPLFDMELIFLRLRGLSVTNKEQVFITDTEDEKSYQCELDFDKIEIKWPDPIPEKIIKIGDYAIKLAYPTASIYNVENAELVAKLKAGQLFDLIIPCIDSIYHKDTLMKLNKKELENFLDNLDIPTYKKIKDFLINMPRVECRLDYKNSLGKDRWVLFTSLMDFFFFL